MTAIAALATINFFILLSPVKGVQSTARKQAAALKNMQLAGVLTLRDTLAPTG
jgi:hypothetical protein